jgi:hypothetical protein
LISRLRQQGKKNPIRTLCKAGAQPTLRRRFHKLYAPHGFYYAISFQSVNGIAYRQYGSFANKLLSG